jgi:hypothetical protein
MSASIDLGFRSVSDLLPGAGWPLGGAALDLGVSPWARAGIAPSIDAAISAAGKQMIKKQRPGACIAASLTVYNCSEIKRDAQSKVTRKSTAENDRGRCGE